MNISTEWIKLYVAIDKIYQMVRITGGATKKYQGGITYVTNNVQTHKEIITPLLHQLGVLNKTKFQEECQGAISVENLRKKCTAEQIRYKRNSKAACIRK